METVEVEIPLLSAAGDRGAQAPATNLLSRLLEQGREQIGVKTTFSSDLFGSTVRIFSGKDLSAAGNRTRVY